MKAALLVVFLGIVIPLNISGCTLRQAYYSAQGWQRNECSKMLDPSERERCLSKANTSYEDYQRQTEDSQKK